MTDRCAVPECRGEVELVYLDHGICDNHWNQLADDVSRSRLRMALGIDTTTPAAMEEPMEENKGTETTEPKEVAVPKKKATKPKTTTPKTATASKTKAPKPKKERASKEPKPGRVFAIRVTDAELEAIHRASGPRNATRLIRAVAAAFASEDEAAFKAVLKEARELRG